MDLKRWLMALALAVFLAAPVGPSTTAFAADGETASAAGPTYHDKSEEGTEGEGEGEEGEGGEGEEGEENGGVVEGLEKVIDIIDNLL